MVLICAMPIFMSALRTSLHSYLHNAACPARTMAGKALVGSKAEIMMETDQGRQA